jgi:DNA-binding GntR family transcriptional regulator
LKGGISSCLVEAILNSKYALGNRFGALPMPFDTDVHSKSSRQAIPDCPNESRTMLHEEVVARLRHMLVEGEIPPGARVPERDLCAAFGISRTPLREALKVLAAEGHIVLLPNRGARAAKLTQKDVQDLFEVCESLEAVAGELACQRISDEALHEICALHAAMAEHYRNRDLPPYYRCNRLIHEAIVQAADNAVLSALYDSVTARIRKARFVVPMPDDHWDLAMREHEAILNALLRRDGSGLAHVLRTHLRNKRLEVERAGFAEAAPAAGRSTGTARVEGTALPIGG